MSGKVVHALNTHVVVLFAPPRTVSGPPASFVRPGDAATPCAAVDHSRLDSGLRPQMRHTSWFRAAPHVVSTSSDALSGRMVGIRQGQRPVATCASRRARSGTRNVAHRRRVTDQSRGGAEPVTPGGYISARSKSLVCGAKGARMGDRRDAGATGQARRGTAAQQMSDSGERPPRTPRRPRGSGSDDLAAARPDLLPGFPWDIGHVTHGGEAGAGLGGETTVIITRDSPAPYSDLLPAGAFG